MDFLRGYPSTLDGYSMRRIMRADVYLVVVVRPAVPVLSAHGGMEVRDPAVGFKMQPHRVDAVREVCLVGIHLAVFIRHLYFVILPDKIIPELPPVLHGEVLCVFLSRADFNADNIILHRRVGLHHVPYTLRVKSARKQVVLDMIYQFRVFLVS